MFVLVQQVALLFDHPLTSFDLFISLLFRSFSLLQLVLNQALPGPSVGQVIFELAKFSFVLLDFSQMSLPLIERLIK